jgi:hypothetical protein
MENILIIIKRVLNGDHDKKASLHTNIRRQDGLWYPWHASFDKWIVHYQILLAPMYMKNW